MSSSSKLIQSGAEIVAEFVDSLRPNDTIDSPTLTALQEQYKTGKFSKTRLLQALEQVRATKLAAIKNGEISPK